MNRSSDNTWRILSKSLIWLVVALVAGQAPVLAYAACCAERADQEMAEMSCCCSETSCAEPSDGDIFIQAAPRPGGCCCLEDSAPLPAHSPNPPATIHPTKLETKVLPALIMAVVASPSSDAVNLCCYPPSHTLFTLASVSAVVLLI